MTKRKKNLKSLCKDMLTWVTSTNHQNTLFDTVHNKTLRKKGKRVRLSEKKRMLLIICF